MNDRRSFEEFVGLGVMNSIPDPTTVAFFRERMRQAGVIEELFEIGVQTAYHGLVAQSFPGQPGCNDALVCSINPPGLLM